MSDWKFIHAADIHLDSPLVGLEQYMDAPSAELRLATRKALGNLVELCITEQVKFLLIAGDIYDGDWKDYSTGLYFLKELSRLRGADIPVFIVRGNHDAASQITRQLPLPENVYEFSHKSCETRLLEDIGVALHGNSFATQAVKEDLSHNYPQAHSGFFNIGLLHTCANGKIGHANYAPCTVQGLGSKGYDYWALGHVHQREVLCEDPWIVFAGNLQGRHIREVGAKGCSLVTVRDGQVQSVEHHTLDVVRWFNSPVTWKENLGRDGVLCEVRNSMQKAYKAGGGRLTAIRITVTGECDDHVEITRNPESFKSDCQALANEMGDDFWLEKVRVATRPTLDMEAARGSEGPVGDLLRYIDTKRQDAAFSGEAWALLSDLRTKLPNEYFDSVEAMQFGDPAQLRILLDDIERELAPRLMDRGVTE